MTTVAATGADQQHPQVDDAAAAVTIGSQAHHVPELSQSSAIEDRIQPEEIKKSQSDSEPEDRSDSESPDVARERRCTSASGAGESEYESVDEGDDSISKEPVLSLTQPHDLNPSSEKQIANKSPCPEQSFQVSESEQEVNKSSCKATESAKIETTKLKNMCWADVSEASDTLLEERVMGESVEEIRKVNENEVQLENKSTSAEVNQQELKNGSPDRHDEDDDEDENYEDIESDASEQQSSRAEIIDSDEIADGQEKHEAGDDDDEDGTDAESTDQPTKPLDDDEDIKKPQYIPKRGAFYEHDDRLGSEEDHVSKGSADRESVTSDSSQPKQSIKPLVISNKKSNFSNRSSSKEFPDHRIARATIESDRWGHDKFNEEEQKPKSREELLNSYGYDIRTKEIRAAATKSNRNAKRSSGQSENDSSRKNGAERRSTNTRRRSSEQEVPVSSSKSSAQTPTTAASRAMDKIAMREAHQERERRRYEKESNHHNRPHRSSEAFGDRRSFERSDNRSNEDRIHDHRKPFSREDFPELTADRSTDSHYQRKSREGSGGAWNRNFAGSMNSSSRRQEQSSDESQERPVVRTQVVYSSTRFSKDNRSPKSDNHSSSYAPATNGNQKNRYDRRDNRHDYRDSRPSTSNWKAAPVSNRQHETIRSHDQEIRTEKSYRKNRREFQNERPSNRSLARKDVDDTLPKLLSGSANNLSSGLHQLSVSSDQRNQTAALDENRVLNIETENRPKRYSATRTLPQSSQPVSTHIPQPNIPITDSNSSHHSPSIAHQQIAPPVSQPPPPQPPPPPPPHQYYESVPQTAPEFYPSEAEGPSYAPYPPDPSGFIAHHSRYISSHPVAPVTSPLNAPSAPPMVGIPTATAAFLPTFTPSLPPSGFPQYPPPPQQYHHQIGPAVAGPAGPPPSGSEMFREGVTYYDTTQQHPIRSLPPKRPKNIIPILPPPEALDATHQHHPAESALLDPSNTRY